MKEIDNIYQDFLNNKYVILLFKTEEPLPKEINVKNMVFYYVNYLYYKKTNNKYFQELSSFVCLPQSNIIIQDLNHFIEIIYYIKYNIEPKEILLKSKDIYQDMKDVSIIRLKQICRKYNITSGKTKTEIINNIINVIKN